MIALVTVTFEIVASGDTEEEVILDALDGVRGFRGAAVHVELHDCKLSEGPATSADLSPSGYDAAQGPR